MNANQKLKTYIQQFGPGINKEGIKFIGSEKANNTGYGDGSAVVHDMADFSRDTNLIPKQGMVLDLGSGLGISSIRWVSEGYKATGIEINESLANLSKRITSNLINKGYMKKNKMKVLQGSYFPAEYIDARNEGLTKAPYFEDKMVFKGHESLGLKVLSPEQNNPEIYTQAGTEFSDFDIYYGFLWNTQTPSALEMFSMYSTKPKAIFTGIFPAIGEKELDEMLDTFELVSLNKELGLKKDFKIIAKKENLDNIMKRATL